MDQNIRSHKITNKNQSHRTKIGWNRIKLRTNHIEYNEIQQEISSKRPMKKSSFSLARNRIQSTDIQHLDASTIFLHFLVFYGFSTANFTLPLFSSLYSAPTPSCPLPLLSSISLLEFSCIFYLHSRNLQLVIYYKTTKRIFRIQCIMLPDENEIFRQGMSCMRPVCSACKEPELKSENNLVCFVCVCVCCML